MSFNFNDKFNDKYPNLIYKNLFYSPTAGIYVLPNEKQIEVYQLLLNNLAEFLVKGERENIKVNSGLRTSAINKTLQKRGYQASNKSDHMLPNEIITKEEFEKKYKNNVVLYKQATQKKFPNPFSSGAIDFIIKNYNLHQHFELFIKLAEKMNGLYNQIIFYKSNFIHLANARKIVYPFDIKSEKPIMVNSNNKYVIVTIENLKKLLKENKLPF